MLLTQNEQKMLRFLAINFHNQYSINNLAKECNLTPNGAYKLLAKMEKEGILKAIKISNLKVYKLNFENDKTTRILELAFMPDKLKERTQLRASDLKSFHAITQMGIMFGSYITSKEKPGDLDVLFVVEKQDYVNYKKNLAKVQDITPIKIQDVVQTPEDLFQNLKKGDPVVISALLNGIVLWGFDVLVKVIEKCQQIS